MTQISRKRVGYTPRDIRMVFRPAESPGMERGQKAHRCKLVGAQDSSCWVSSSSRFTSSKPEPPKVLQSLYTNIEESTVTVIDLLKESTTAPRGSMMWPSEAHGWNNEVTSAAVSALPIRMRLKSKRIFIGDTVTLN